MANTIKIKRGSGSDPAASDMVLGEPVLRTDTAELFFKKDDGSVAKVSGGGGGPDFKYLALRNAANNGAASYPNADFTLVTSGTTNAITPAAANTLLVSVNGVIQKPNTGTSTPSSGFALSGSTIKFGTNISAAPDFILYQESGGIGEPSDETVTEAKLKVSNNPVNGYFLSAQSGNTGGLTWAAPVATSCTGNSATATALATARAINGVNFDGTAAITVTAAAGTLSGTTLNSSVVTSSLTSLGDLGGLTVDGDATFTGANYNVLWDKSDNALEFADNAKAIFGTGSDLQIYHDGTNSFITNTTGSLKVREDNIDFQNSAGTENLAKFAANGAVELYYDNSKKLKTTSTGVGIPGGLSIESYTQKLTVGGSAELEIYHNNTNSFIVNTEGTLEVHSKASETSAKFVPDGQVELYHNGTKKFETTSYGALLSGNLQVNTVYPSADSSYDIGTNSTRFANGYFDTLYGDGSNLTGVSAGATGGGSDEVFYENSTTVTTSYSITSNKNAMSAGPISINNSVTVTVPSGSVWTIV